jgi:hypothetical protein
MREPKPAHLAMARRLLELEAQGADDDEAAAGRVFERTFALLSPILGTEGTSALFARAAQLAAARFPTLGDTDLDADRSVAPVQAMVARLRRAPATSRETAVAVYATLSSLLETLIGERLTSQLLRGAWPTDDAVEQETK